MGVIFLFFAEIVPQDLLHSPESLVSYLGFISFPKDGTGTTKSTIFLQDWTGEVAAWIFMLKSLERFLNALSSDSEVQVISTEAVLTH